MNGKFIPVDGEALRRLRQDRALSLRELGKRSAQPRTVRKLAEALGVEPRELMKGD